MSRTDQTRRAGISARVVSQAAGTATATQQGHDRCEPEAPLEELGHGSVERARPGRPSVLGGSEGKVEDRDEREGHGEKPREPEGRRGFA
ncbi:hypothetical protein [Candidatus Amarobacter glycogenicus]|uniref:hypothetical protein n=1 Tax=Candidatus Amarobacter glycogenicus TaxID=3140699 RepID=UPI0031CCC755